MHGLLARKKKTLTDLFLAVSYALYPASELWIFNPIISFPLNNYPHTLFISEVKTAFSNLLRRSYSNSLQVFFWKLLRISTDPY